MFGTCESLQAAFNTEPEEIPHHTYNNMKCTEESKFLSLKATGRMVKELDKWAMVLSS